LRLATSSSARFGAASPTQLCERNRTSSQGRRRERRILRGQAPPATAAAMRAENAAASASRSASRAASSSASTRPAIAAKARRRLRSARLSYADIQVRAAGRASPPTPRSNRRAGSPANGRGALALRRLEIDEGGSGPACGISPCGHGRSVTPELRRPFADLQKSLRSK
jgi:hypothetical protein